MTAAPHLEGGDAAARFNRNSGATQHHTDIIQITTDTARKLIDFDGH